MKRVIACGAAATAVVLATGISPAGACHPEVVATSVCVDGEPAIHVVATAWESDLGADWRTNTDVRIDVWGAMVAGSASGAFTAPEHRMAVTLAVPEAAGQTLTVRATAVAPWGPNQEHGFAGTYRETWVTVTDDCASESTPIKVPTEPAALPPSAATPAPGTVAASDAEPAPAAVATEVLSVSLDRAVQPQVSQPTTLAFTGRSSAGTATVGAGLALAGTLLIAASGRRRSAGGDTAGNR